MATPIPPVPDHVIWPDDLDRAKELLVDERTALSVHRYQNEDGAWVEDRSQPECADGVCGIPDHQPDSI